MANKFVVWYCLYDPDNYLGHRRINLKATNMEDAEKEVFEILNGAWIKRIYEYHIYETVADSGPRVYDVIKQKRL